MFFIVVQSIFFSVGDYLLLLLEYALLNCVNIMCYDLVVT